MSSLRGAARALLARRRLLLAVAAAGVLYRNRRLISVYASRSACAARRALATAERLATVGQLVSADMVDYLEAPAAHEASSAASEASDVASPYSAALPPPRSLRRLLRIAASADALVVLRAVASSAAREVISGSKHSVIRASRARDSRFSSASFRSDGTAPSAREELQSPLTAASTIEMVFAVLDTPAGSRVASLLVSTAVKEAVSTIAEHQTREAARRPTSTTSPAGAADTSRHWLDVVLTAGLSDRGKGVLVEVATAITRAAVPALVTAQAQQQHLALAQLRNSQAATPQRRQRPISTSGVGGPIPVPPNGGNCPPSKQLMMAMLATNSNSNWMDRAAMLASRERGLVRDVVRTVASETIRAYLTTQAELQLGVKSVGPSGGGAASDMAVPVPSSPSCNASNLSSPRQSFTLARARVERQISRGPAARLEHTLEQKKPFDSLWKALALSLVADVRKVCEKAFNDYVAAPPLPRWFFF